MANKEQEKGVEAASASHLEEVAHMSLADFQARERKPLVHSSKRCVQLDVYPYPGGVSTYDIEWRRIDSPEKLLQWILHLSEKTWFTTSMCSDLIHAVAEHFGWDPWRVNA